MKTLCKQNKINEPIKKMSWLDDMYLADIIVYSIMKTNYGRPTMYGC